MPNPRRIAFVCHRVGPYHFARYRAAGRHCDAVVIEASAEDKKNAWSPIKGAEGFERTTVYPEHDSRSRPGQEVARRIGAALDRARPELVVVPGYTEAFEVGALRWCARRRVPAVLLFDGTSWDRARTPAKEAIKRRMARLFSAAFGAGTAARDYLEALGFSRESIVTGAQVVDNEHFAAGAEAARKSEAETRARLGMPQKYFLLAARFLFFKNIPRLLEAYARYRELASKGGGTAWNLVLVGDGPDKPGIARRISELGLEKSAILAGYKDYQEMPAWYAMAGAVVLPSIMETWGLVVNEGMAAGLPVLVSTRCGCAVDLAREGVNGYVFDPLDVAALSDCMRRVSDPANNWEAMAKASRGIIAGYTPESFGAGAMKAVEIALGAPLPKPSWLDFLLLQALPFRKPALG